MNFEDLKLAPAIVLAVREHGYETPTPIQAQAIPAVLEGQDLLAGAQTGTGKTAAFVLPILHKLSMSRSATNRFGGYAIRCLVLTPTRELAAQVEESVRVYGKHLQLRSTAVFGGVGMKPQIDRIKSGVDILVATPGRLLDLMQQGIVELSQVQVLVLDEADRMLDMGFIHDVKKVLAAVPKEKQSLLFSATFSDEIRDLAAALLRNPQSIQVTPRNTTVQLITQTQHPVGRGKKKALLAHIIEQNNWSQVLVFTRTKFGANNVAEHLCKAGIKSLALHGNKSQGARTQALQDFKSGDIRALVATDIAARGIDIEDLPHVVNYEIPNVSQDYVHRIGRTGRAGASGEAVSLVSLDEEGFMADIESYIKQPIPKVLVEGFAPEPGERAEPIAMGRQTIWGGLGKPPSREVMMAAAKNARAEMNQRIREGRSAGGQAGRTGGGEGGQGASRSNGGARGQGGARGNGANRGNGGGARGNGGPRAPGASQARGAGYVMQRQEPQAFSHESEGLDESQERMPREGAHLGTQAGRHFRPPARGQGAAQGQPDPLRTSIDSMAGSGRRGGGGGAGRGRSGAGGGYSGGGGGGGAGRPAGPRGGAPRSYGR